MKQEIGIRKLSGSLGAEISGVALNNLSNEAFDTICNAFADHSVLVFKNQTLSHEDQIAFARRFGDLEIHPIVNGMDEHPEMIKMLKPAGESASFGVGWHTDNSFFAEPSMGSIVYSHIVPQEGGDTLFANQYVAYERLSDGMKRMLNGLNAVHSAKYAYTSKSAEEKYAGKTAITYRRSDTVYDEVTHPVVRTHPVTGKKALYVNPMFTTRFEDMSEEESKPLLTYLFDHCVRPEFGCRVGWTPNMVTMWDNRCVQHYAVDDYKAYERLLYRVTVNGDKPV
ncbi:MAG: TauD/TfdA family dioxygenase [Parvibaculum sp.]